MTIKEFLEKNPAAVEEAAKCTSIEEFKKLTDKAGIIFKNDEETEKAFNTVKNYNNGELSDDELNSVSGGKHLKYDSDHAYIKHDGTVIVEGSGQKIK